MAREVRAKRPAGCWKPLSNMSATPAMFALSDMMLRWDIANPGRLPYLGAADKLLVISDIAGTRNHPYEVYSFLISGQGMMNTFLQTAVELRETLPDKRRISHKRLNSDKVVGRIITPFLEAADQIPGFLLCVAIDSRIDSLHSAEFLHEWAPKLKWDRRTLERAMRVITYIGFLLSGFARPGQSVFWLSDEDSILANNRMIEQLRIIIPPLWRSFLSFDLPFAHFADTRISDRDILAEDLVSVVDVAAGATLEQLRRGDGTFPLTGRSIPTMQWLCTESSQLVKRLLLVKPAADGNGLVHTWPTFTVTPPSAP